jgi:ribosome-binding factor A
MFVCRPLAPPRLLAVAPPGTARGPWSLRPPSLSLRVVRCMAKEKRVRMVAKQIQRELADMLTRDPILQRAVLPEATSSKPGNFQIYFTDMQITILMSCTSCTDT